MLGIKNSSGFAIRLDTLLYTLFPDYRLAAFSKVDYSILSHLYDLRRNNGLLQDVGRVIDRNNSIAF